MMLTSFYNSILYWTEGPAAAWSSRMARMYNHS
jgi:hypothetical protein